MINSPVNYYGIKKAGMCMPAFFAMHHAHAKHACSLASDITCQHDKTKENAEQTSH